jgi:hypothetical protein
MPDMEKVLKGLEVCLAADLSTDENPCAPCPYFFDRMCQDTIKKDALALLREQEPVEPHVEHDGDDDSWYYGCGACNEAIDYKDRFCRHCGRKVKWDDVRNHAD